MCFVGRSNMFGQVDLQPKGINEPSNNNLIKAFFNHKQYNDNNNNDKHKINKIPNIKRIRFAIVY